MTNRYINHKTLCRIAVIRLESINTKTVAFFFSFDGIHHRCRYANGM